MKKACRIPLILLNLIVFIPTGCQKSYSLREFQTPHAKAEMRTRFYENLIADTIQKIRLRPLNPQTEADWQAAFWAMELIGYRSPEILAALKQSFTTFPESSVNFQRALLEAVYTLYPTEFESEMTRVARITRQPKIFAMAVCYLKRIDPDDISYSAWLRENFPEWPTHPILHRLALMDSVTPPMPPLQAILSHPIAGGMSVIYSLQRPNRDFPGLLVAKTPDGRFLRNEDGSLFHIPQLARSLSNLPGFLTNGNTPQGIFSFNGVLTSQSIFIGPSPTLQMVLPFEAAPVQFFHQTVSEEKWTVDLYRRLLPVAWQNYAPIFEAFFAGEAGRNEIIAHGTTVNPEFYRGTPYYPFTPSLGCLTALELWSPADGRCVVSGQIQLLNQLQRHNIETGFLVVVNLADKSQPVTLGEVLPDLLAAEVEVDFNQ